MTRKNLQQQQAPSAALLHQSSIGINQLLESLESFLFI